MPLGNSVGFLLYCQIYEGEFPKAGFFSASVVCWCRGSQLSHRTFFCVGLSSLCGFKLSLCLQFSELILPGGVKSSFQLPHI